MANNQRVKELFAYLKENKHVRNQQDFSERVFSDKSTISQILNDKIDVPNVLFGRITAAFPQISMNWLLTGEGDMLKGEKPSPEISLTDGIPYFDVDFQLGFDELEHPGSPNPEFLIRMPGYEKATLWCNAVGQSMEPEISPGDRIALQHIEDFSFLPYGDIYAFITTNGMRTIKRLGHSDREGFYRLVPSNPDFDAQDIPISQIAVVYRVLGTMKPF